MISEQLGTWKIWKSQTLSSSDDLVAIEQHPSIGQDIPLVTIKKKYIYNVLRFKEYLATPRGLNNHP